MRLTKGVRLSTCLYYKHVLYLIPWPYCCKFGCNTLCLLLIRATSSSSYEPWPCLKTYSPNFWSHLLSLGSVWTPDCQGAMVLPVSWTKFFLWEKVFSNYLNFSFVVNLWHPNFASNLWPLNVTHWLPTVVGALFRHSLSAHVQVLWFDQFEEISSFVIEKKS